MTARSRTPRLGAALLGLTLTVSVAAAPIAQAAPEDLAAWVNPFVGTKPGGPDHGTGGGAGNNFPGAVVPFGMMQWSPDTVTHQHGGYFYDDNRIKGFSLTHLSGAGCSTYQDIPIMPIVGEVTTSPATDPGRYVSTFSHTNEKASPGRYEVKLDSGAKVELTATQRTGLGRVTFPEGRPATILVNSSGSIAGADDAETVIGTDSISGWASSGRFCSAKNNKYRVYYHVQFDRPFASVGTWKDGSVSPGQTRERGGSKAKVDLDAVDAPKATADKGKRAAPKATGPLDTTVSGPGSGGFVTFDPFDGETVQMRVGLSFVSVDGAKNNLVAENLGTGFDAMAAAARAQWNERLNTIRVTGGTDAQRTTFYTALYHSLVQPNVFSDADGRYIGFDGRIHSAEPGHATYTNLSGWDIYRSEIQLLSVIAPAEASDISRSMIAFAEQGGSWDRWTVANSYSGVMVGDPYHIMVAASYAFGAKDFDARKALLLMIRGATQKTQGYEERPGLEEFLKLGYVPLGTPGAWGPPATTLEYTSADFAIADLARRLGDSATWQTFSKRSQYWQNLFNSETGYIQPRLRDGSFLTPFNPGESNNWVEGNAAQYTWMVPHNAAGLITAMGGNENVVKRLDNFFTKLNAGPNEPYAFLGNEPIMHAPWLYNFAGAPHRTQEVTRRAVNDLFGPGPNGLMGNDDLGQMSSWYVWAAMGMYPVLPGRAELVLNSPLFPEITVQRPGGSTWVIKAPGAAAKNQYVSGVKVNGRTLNNTWLPESFVERGGTVEFALQSTPNTTWGGKPENAPPSFREGETGQRGLVSPGRQVIAPGGSGTVTVSGQDFSGKGAKIRWSAQPPNGVTLTPASGELVLPTGGTASVDVAVKVAEGQPEGLVRIPVTFTGDGGSNLAPAAAQVLVTQPNSIRAAYNNAGTSPDDDPSSGDIDGGGWSLSRNALANVGVRPGGTVTVDGLAHRWPDVPKGEPDNATPLGQTVNLAAPQGATKVALLGLATNGKATAKLRLNYDDGTSSEAQFGFNDWAESALDFGNRNVVTMAYRNARDGQQSLTVRLFATPPLPVEAGKQLVSVTLPRTAEGGLLHVFTVTAG
ncbi:putative alpha-1,2-mannosidase [Crossiella equi]|uniref:Alpha-1,2-mannosidase n=1 Tax=Crossiella equi TaxID=130796 RepID=A0ABS5AKU2_9PSEU|nr:GH92 family glycosyl hydrolase [Crossiella equi]MBP2476844.1 putative alpha-1,2-mannosidase [Crossiella equi]